MRVAGRSNGARRNKRKNNDALLSAELTPRRDRLRNVNDAINSKWFLPTVSRDGKNVSRSNKRKPPASDPPDESSPDVEISGVSKKKRKRLENIQAEFAKKEKALQHRKEIQAEIAAVGGPKAFSEKQALISAQKELVRRGKEYQLALVAWVAQAVIADPQKYVWRLGLLFFLCDSRNILSDGSKDIVEDLHKEVFRLHQQEKNAPLGMRIWDISFIALGTIFKEIIPAYRLGLIAGTQEKLSIATKGARMLSRTMSQQTAFEKQLLDFFAQYMKMLKQRCEAAIMDMIHAEDVVSAAATLREASTVTAVVTSLLEAAPGVNFGEELLSLCINIAACSPSRSLRCYCEALDASVPLPWSTSCRCLSSLIEKSGDLQIAASIAKRIGDIAKRTVQAKTKRVSESENSALGCKAQLTGQLLLMLSSIDFSKKEAIARREAESLGLNKKSLDKHLKADLGRSSIVGDFRRFHENRKIVLQNFVVAVLRIFRAPQSFPKDSLSGALIALSQLAPLLSVELVIELCSELRLVIERFLLNPSETLTAINAVLRLTRRYGDTDAFNLDFITWLPDVYFKVLLRCVPYLSRGSLQGDAAEVRLLQNKSKDGAATSIIASSKAKGSNSAEASDLEENRIIAQILDSIDLVLACAAIQLAGDAYLLKLIETLLTIALNCAERVPRLLLLEKIQMLVKARPKVQSLFDVDGAILPSLGTEISAFWHVDLITTGLYATADHVSGEKEVAEVGNYFRSVATAF